MGKKALSERDNWQTEGGNKATVAEMSFSDYMKKNLPAGYKIISKPKDFKHIYEDVALDEETMNKIYDPKVKYSHGFQPDYAIINNDTKKTIYIEVKRQDGWVEGKPRSAGRGNAHERSNKLFTPGLLSVMREAGKIDRPALPFWVVFQGDISRDPARVREVTFWYKDFQNHFFFWRKENLDDMMTHFNMFIKPLLD